MIMRQSDGIIAPMFKVFVVTKGQIISKGLFGATVSTKNPMKFFKEFLPYPLKRGEIKK